MAAPRTYGFRVADDPENSFPPGEKKTPANTAKPQVRSSMDGTATATLNVIRKTST